MRQIPKLTGTAKNSTKNLAETVVDKKPSTTAVTNERPPRILLVRRTRMGTRVAAICSGGTKSRWHLQRFSRPIPTLRLEHHS